MRIPSTLVRTPRIKKSWRSNTDPQAAKVYLMERDFIGWIVETLHTREYLESVMKHASRKWGVKEPKLFIFKNKKYDHLYGYCSETGLHLNGSKDKPGANMGTMIHELAHWIVDEKYPEAGLEYHGARFITVYGQLLNDYKLFPEDCWKVLCDRHGVEYVRDDS